jgi:glucosyl-dolichyl phosphate glucuronosyltransferase
VNPAVTIVIPAHADTRWHSLVRTIASARSQTLIPAEIVVVVDHNTALFRRVRRDIGGITVLESSYGPGVAGARNTGAFHAQTSLVAFLDDDTSADPRWLDRLIRPFTDPRVVGGGGGINPDWAMSRPRWMTDEFLWAVGGSHAGDVRAASMLVRRESFMAIGGFRTGAVGADLRDRLTRLDGGRWVYVPDATVRCAIPPSRTTFLAYLQGCYAGGRAGARPRTLASAVRGHGLPAAGALAGVFATAIGALIGPALDDLSDSPRPAAIAGRTDRAASLK